MTEKQIGAHMWWVCVCVCAFENDSERQNTACTTVTTEEKTIFALKAVKTMGHEHVVCYSDIHMHAAHI